MSGRSAEHDFVLLKVQGNNIRDLRHAQLHHISLLSRSLNRSRRALITSIIARLQSTPAAALDKPLSARPILLPVANPSVKPGLDSGEYSRALSSKTSVHSTRNRHDVGILVWRAIGAGEERCAQESHPRSAAAA